MQKENLNTVAYLAVANDVCARWRERFEASHDGVHLCFLIEGKQACAEHDDDEDEAEVDGLVRRVNIYMGKSV